MEKDRGFELRELRGLELRGRELRGLELRGRELEGEELVRVALLLVLRGRVRRDVGDTRGAVVGSRSCVVVLVEAKGSRGTRISRDVQGRCTRRESGFLEPID